MSMYNSEDDAVATKLEYLKADLKELKQELIYRYESDDSKFSLDYLEKIMRSIDNLIDNI